MVDFSKSFSYKIEVYRVDPTTWADSELAGIFDSVSISRSTGRMVESANMTGTIQQGTIMPEGYYRVVAKINQDRIERVELITVYCISSSGTSDYGVDQIDITGVSVLYPAQQTTVEIGSFVPRLSDGAVYVKRLLDKTLQAPVVVDGSFVLSDDYVFDIGTSVLDCVWTLLDAAGWCIQIDGNGTVHVMPKPSEPSLFMESGSMTMHGTEHSVEIASVPNRYQAFDGTNLGVATNEDPNSIVSVYNRGFIKDFDGGIDTSPVLIDGESITAYSLRKLRELSTLTYSMSKTREYAVGVHPYSMVRIKDEDGIESHDVRVVSQEIRCSEDMTVDETYAMEVSVWQG